MSSSSSSTHKEGFTIVQTRRKTPTSPTSASQTSGIGIATRGKRGFIPDLHLYRLPPASVFSTSVHRSCEEKYYNAPTYHKSRASIIHDMAHLGVVAVGKSSLSEIKAGYNDSTTDTAARISFKYGCSRGVTGTPFFFVNGIQIPDYGSAIDYKKWKSIVDPLLAKREE